MHSLTLHELGHLKRGAQHLGEVDFNPHTRLFEFREYGLSDCRPQKPDMTGLDIVALMLEIDRRYPGSG